MKRFGRQATRYVFFLNPYEDLRWTSCPQCGVKTRQRKLPLVIFIEPNHVVALNKTCRYCPACDLLIAHKDQLESLLVAMFAERAPQHIGKDYLVVGTLDRPDWLAGVNSSLGVKEMRDVLHDFKRAVTFTPAPQWVYAPPKTTTKR